MRKLLRKSMYKYLLSFLVMLLVILSMGVKPLITDIMGERIYLKTLAYDPRDLFRGDYVTLNYEINEIEFNKIDQDIIDAYVEDGYYITYGLEKEKLYVSLVSNGTFYEVEKVSLSKPSDGIYIVGKYSYTLGMRDSYAYGIRVEYTLDKFFVPENTGKLLEDKVRDGEAFAVVKVYNGYPLLKDIVVSPE
ncbi:GDYXXLXY domain-containing protein [Mycoplasmatota bacterium WC44]